ncbi:MAG: hypothetical protein CMP76_07985 [Flavobacterium sp.]|uniref:hypothetical protein n=1 Tax=Flavobacterium sp. TaxID=239 RepID=UPI000C417E95|nr:hypothetical protein [Flavobacterium sp.]MBF03220.1 hypothetical protein [Flavobacterium sp.]
MNLFRNLKSGTKYNALLPQSSCKKVNLGEGDTSFSVEMIAKQALQHTNQVTQLANELANETNGSLEAICNNIHSFLYWHLQYKADGEAQLLRSPACAWQQRHKGIDCKSYSIFASAILLQLGFKHYIRRIKQATYNPDYFTHVYIIVPLNQSTGKLDKGYYTIDGTLPFTSEPPFIQKNDFYMDALPHYGLNGSELSLNNLSFDGVKDILSTPISCWGGTSFNAVKAEEVANTIGAYFENVLIEINNAVATNDTQKLSKLFAHFQSTLGTAVWAYSQKKSQGWNKCTTESITRMQNILNFYQKVVEIGLNAWLNKYYVLTSTGTKTTGYKNDGNFELVDPAFFFTYTDPNIGYNASIYNFQLKEGVTQIPVFEFTPYVEQVASNPSSFDPLKFLQGLSTVLVSFTGDNTGTSGNGQVYDNNNPNYDQYNSQTKQMGFGTVGIVLGGLLIGGYLMNKNKEKNKPKETTATKTPKKVTV